MRTFEWVGCVCGIAGFCRSRVEFCVGAICVLLQRGWYVSVSPEVLPLKKWPECPARISSSDSTLISGRSGSLYSPKIYEVGKKISRFPN